LFPDAGGKGNRGDQRSTELRAVALGCRFNILVKLVEHRNQAINGETGKPRLPNARNIRRRASSDAHLRIGMNWAKT